MGYNDSLDIDQAGLEFIARWEGCILRVYRDVAGYKTFGVGHLVTPAEDYLYPDRMPISYELAMHTLLADAQKCVDAIRQYIQVPLNQHQFNALCSFSFNCGTGVIRNSGVSRAINSGNLSGVQNALLQYSKAKINGVLTTVPGLYNRRVSEAKLFYTPVEQPPPQYTPEELAHIQAQLDESAKRGVSYAVLACSDSAEDEDAMQEQQSLMCV